MEFLFLFFFVNRRRHFVCLIFFGSGRPMETLPFFLAGVFLLFFFVFHPWNQRRWSSRERKRIRYRFLNISDWNLFEKTIDAILFLTRRRRKNKEPKKSRNKRGSAEKERKRRPRARHLFSNLHKFIIKQ